MRDSSSSVTFILGSKGAHSKFIITSGFSFLSFDTRNSYAIAPPSDSLFPLSSEGIQKRLNLPKSLILIYRLLKTPAYIITIQAVLSHKLHTRLFRHNSSIIVPKQPQKRSLGCASAFKLAERDRKGQVIFDACFNVSDFLVIQLDLPDPVSEG